MEGKSAVRPAEDGESLPVVDEEGRVTGSAPRSRCHSGEGARGLLHPVVRLWLSDGRGGYWLQKRSPRKLVQPGKWDCAVGGHLSYGESVEEGLAREAYEEIALPSAEGARLAARFVWETPLERELAYLFVLEAGAAVPRPNPAEVSETRAWSAAEIGAETGKPAGERALTPMAAYEWERFLGGPRRAPGDG